MRPRAAHRCRTVSAAVRAALASLGLAITTLHAGCESYDPPQNEESFEPCCSGLGTCVPEGLLPSKTRSQLGADTCQSQLLCVPKALAEDGEYVARTCKSTGKAEGRCLPSCLPEVQARADQLPRDSCAELESCVPCFDPRTGEETGACRLGGDPGPQQPAYVFGRCCDGVGRCVPGEVVQRVTKGGDLSQLGSRDCSEPEAICMSEAWLDADRLELTACKSLLGYEGRCVPRCITNAASEIALPRDTCEATELCAPCYDPRTGADTGACRQGDDQPQQPPKQFAECCRSGEDQKPLGRCVPRSFVETVAEPGDVEQLGQDICSERDALCTPALWLEDPDSVLVLCRAVGDFEGRCVPACLPAVADYLDRLTQSSCGSGSLCAPCYDPVTGVDTGVCRQRDDAPKEPPSTFAACCGAGPGTSAVGRCVSRELAASMAGAQSFELERLGADSCADDDALCVPSAWLERAEPNLAHCVAVGRFEGRCMPSCLPDVQSRAGQLTRDSCAASEMCVPCYDPFTGAATGACSLAGDEPLLPAQTFEACCRSAGQDARGRCVPRSLLESSDSAVGQDLARLGRDTCSDSDVLCVPSAWLDEAQPTAASCSAVGSSEGRCLPGCLPDVQAQAANLRSDVCANGDLCVPCFDPFSGEESGACGIGDDRPTTTGQAPEACCNSGGEARGRCISRDLLESSGSGVDLAALGRDSCQSEDTLCVPEELAGSAGAQPPVSCRLPGNLEGRCMSDCLPSVAGQTDRLSQGSCRDGQLCAPCYDPQTRAPTGVCSIAGDQPQEPPGEFETCCGTGAEAKGTCVPVEFLDESQMRLAVDSCSAYPARCVPAAQFAMPDKDFPACATELGSRGLCIGACFLGSSAAGVLSRTSCAADERCAPCSSIPTTARGCE